MPASVTFAGRLAHLSLVGDYTPLDIKAALDAALAASEFPEDALLLMDLTASQSLDKRKPEDLQQMASHLAGLSQRFGFRLGIAAAKDLHYGMMRMAEVYSESSGMTARVFRSVAEAVAWLEDEG